MFSKLLVFLVACWTILASVTLMVQPVNANSAASHWEGMYFCKCVCFGTNYTILPIYRPANPQKPCLSCTKQWCLDQKLAMCIGADIGGTDPDTGTGKEGDVEGRCFQRDSPRDQLVVTLFLLIVFGLLLGAAIRGRMEKAGLSFTSQSLAHTSQHWWEFFLPSRLPPRPPTHVGGDLENDIGDDSAAVGFLPLAGVSHSGSTVYSVVSNDEH